MASAWPCEKLCVAWYQRSLGLVAMKEMAQAQWLSLQPCVALSCIMYHLAQRLSIAMSCILVSLNHLSAVVHVLGLGSVISVWP